MTSISQDTYFFPHNTVTILGLCSNKICGCPLSEYVTDTRVYWCEDSPLGGAFQVGPAMLSSDLLLFGVAGLLLFMYLQVWIEEQHTGNSLASFFRFNYNGHFLLNNL